MGYNRSGRRRTEKQKRFKKEMARLARKESQKAPTPPAPAGQAK
jgi:hypothetical protein